MNIYCISGLGADKRVFEFLKLPNHRLIHLEWITPLSNESLSGYAHRLADGIDTSQPFALMGLSFGGMLAVEIAQEKKPVELFVLSSILGKHEVPALHRFAGNIRLHEIIPAHILKSPNIFTYMAFGLETKESKALMKQILKDTDPDFFVWALKAILSWDNESIPVCTRIHGTRDRILPVERKSVEHVIENGGHFAIVDRADEFSTIINQKLAHINQNMI